jgi:DNA end-binding protein Ku
MDALRQSIATGRRTPAAEKTTAPKAKKGKKRAAGQREMLLPIAGKATSAAKEAKKPAARPAARQRKAG